MRLAHMYNMVPLNGPAGVTRAQGKVQETIHNPFIGCYATYKLMTIIGAQTPGG